MQKCNIVYYSNIKRSKFVQQAVERRKHVTSYNFCFRKSSVKTRKCSTVKKQKYIHKYLSDVIFAEGNIFLLQMNAEKLQICAKPTKNYMICV
jgi:hypothetical protein